MKRVQRIAKKVQAIARHPEVRRASLRISLSVLAVVLIVASIISLLPFPDSKKEQGPGDTQVKANYQYSATSGNLVQGTEQNINGSGARTAEGVNRGSWRATINDDDLHWMVASTSTGIDAQLNIDGVTLNGANKLIFQTEFDLDATAIQLAVQICDWVSNVSLEASADAQCTGGGWRSLNTQDSSSNTVNMVGTSPTVVQWHVYDGYYGVGANPISTPLSNFVTTDANKRIKIRFRGTNNTTSLLAIDFLRVHAVVDPVYMAGTQTVTTGVVGTGRYYQMNPIGNTTSTQYSTVNGDGQYYEVAGTAGSIADFFFNFNNVNTYSGMNSIVVNARYRCSTTGINHRPKIWNFNTSAWEDLTTASIACSATDANSAWAKNNINIDHYVSSGQVRVGWYGLANGTQSIMLDILYVVLGSTNSDSALCEITLGTGTATNCTNSRTLDMTGTTTGWQNPTEAESNTMGTGEANSNYAFDHDMDATASENGAAANLSFPVTMPSNAAVVGTHFVGRFTAGAAGTVALGMRDYSGLLGTEGGWTAVGATSTTAQVYTDSITALTISSYGLNNSPEDYVDTLNNRMNLRLRTSVSGASATRDWDFAFVSVAWINDSAHPTKLHQFNPTSQNLITGTDQQTLAQTAVSNEGVNMGSWKGTLADDDFHWVVAGTASGANVQLNYDEVKLYGANRIFIDTELDLDATALSTAIQICDWVSTTSVNNAADAQCTGGGWRTVNTRNTANTPVNFTATTAQAMSWHIHENYWSTGTTGGTPVVTPLSNFVKSDTKQVKIRLFSTTNSTATIAIDYLRVTPVIDSVYHPSGMTNLGSGTVSGHYGNANVIGNVAGGQFSTSNTDGLPLGVAGTAGSVFDFYVSFKDVKTYTGMNTIMMRADYSCSATGINHRPKIWNFNSSAWEDLSTANIACALTENLNVWAKNNVTISNYISSGEIRIGWRGLANAATRFDLDLMYIMVGSTNSDTALCQVTVGTGTASNCTNSRTIDTTGTTTTWDNPTEQLSTNMGTGEANSFYGHDPDEFAAVSNEDASAYNQSMTVTIPTNAAVTGVHYASRFGGGAAGTVVTSLRDYTGVDSSANALGGWLDVGFTTTTAVFHTDSIQAFGAGSNAYGINRNPDDFIDSANSRINMRHRTWTGNATAATRVWDFAMASIQWIELGSSISGNIYSDEGSSIFNCSTTNLTVAVRINGNGTHSTICTDSGGNYLIEDLDFGDGDVVTVFLDDETQNAVTVIRPITSASTTGVDLYQDRVVLRHEDPGPVTNGNLDLYDSGQDSDVQFTVTSSNLTVSSGSKLVVISGDTFTPGGNVTTPALRLSGTYVASTFTLELNAGGTSSTCTDAAGTVQPLCISSGTFTQDTSTVNYTGTAATTVAGASYYNVGVGTTSNSTAVTYTLGGNTLVQNVLTVGHASSSATDTLAGGSATLTLSGGSTPFVITSQGTFTANTSTVLYTGNGSNVTQATYNQLKIGEANGMARQSGLQLSESSDNTTAAAIDSTNGFAYFGTRDFPGEIVKVRLSDFKRVGVLKLDPGERDPTAGVIDQTNGFLYFALNDPTTARVVKIDLATFTVIGYLSFAGESPIVSAVIDEPNDFAYFGTNASPGRVLKLNLNTFASAGGISMNTGENSLFSAVIDQPNGFAYFGAAVSPGIVVKINLSSFTRTGAVSFSTGENGPRSAVIDLPNGFAYFGTNTNPGIVVKINLSSFTRTGGVTLNSGEFGLLSAVIDQPNGFAYFGTQAYPTGIVVKIDLSSFTRDSALTLNSGEGDFRAAVIDAPNGSAYFATFHTVATPGNAVKIDLSNFSRNNGLFFFGENDLRAAVIDQPNGFAYFAANQSPAIIIKIRLSDFTFVDALRLNTGENSIASAVIDQPNGFAYFGTGTTPGQVVKVNLATFTRVGAISMNSGENTLSSAVIDQPNGFAYFGTTVGLGSADFVVKINLSTFTRVGAVSLNSGEVHLTSAVIDQPNGFAYFGTNTATTEFVIKINLSSFTRVGAITMDSGDNDLLSAVIDQPSGFAYFGASVSPARIIKINLSTFTRDSSLTLNSGENGARSAFFDQTNGFAYFGTATSPGRMVKVKLSNFTNDGAITLNSGENTLACVVVDIPNGYAYFGTSTSPGIVVKMDIAVPTSHTIGTSAAPQQTITTNADLEIIGTATAETHDPIVDVNGNVIINAVRGTYVASSTASFTVAGNWTNNGTFTSGTGTVTFDTTGTSTLTGATSFHHFTSTTAGKTLQFQKHTGGVPVFTFTGTYTITGASGNQIHIHSDTGGSQWKAHFNSAQSSVTHAHIHDAGCDTGTANVTLDATSTDGGNNDICWVFPAANPTFEQSAYRFGNNEDGTTVNYTGSPSANSPLTVTTSGQKFRLRLLLHVGTANLATNGQNFKLKFGEKPAAGCASATYADVDPSSGVIRYFNNPTPADADDLTTNAGDPTHSGHTIRNQDYEESNNFTNSVSAINAGEDGKWDFSLENNSSVGGKRYCFKVTKSDNSDIDTYTVYPEVSIEEELTFSLDSTSKNFGVITPGGSPTDQTTTITTKTNAANGYQVTLWATQLLTKGASTIPNWTGTNGTPTTFSGVGFGYSTNDSNLGGGTADRFTNPSAKFAGFVLSGSGDRVADNTGPAFSNENFNITYRLAVSGTQPAGIYNTNLIYICTGSY